MARILDTKQTAFAIGRIINEADKFVGLITPYINFTHFNNEWKVVLTEIKDACNRDITIFLILRDVKDNQDDYKTQQKAIKKLFSKIDPKVINNIKIHYCPNLHAKCYFNSQKAVVSSLNLTFPSVKNDNNELSVLINHETDNETFRQLMFYVNDICRNCQEPMHWIDSHGSINKYNIENVNEQKGYCIYCGKQIQFNTDNPICASCKPELDKGYKFSDTYCHSCGGDAYGKYRTSLRRPYHLWCYHKL